MRKHVGIKLMLVFIAGILLIVIPPVILFPVIGVGLIAFCCMCCIKR